jgi:hypothetical protein
MPTPLGWWKQINGPCRLNPNSEVEQSDLTQSTDRKEVFSILACINRYALGSPQLLSAST